MVIMNDLEWPMFSYYVIYYEKLKKSHAVNREGHFNFLLARNEIQIPRSPAQWLIAEWLIGI